MAPRVLSRAEVMRIALGERGYREGRNNANKYSQENGRGAEFWCQDFAQWVLQSGHVVTPITASCQYAESWYKRHGQLHTVPRVGDQFFVYFSDPRFRRVAHTGFVTGISADGRTVFTIEGNSNPGGSRNGYGVFRRARPVLAPSGRTGIRSYGRPVYGKAPVPPKPKPKPKPKPAFRIRDLDKALRLPSDGKWNAATERRAAAFRQVAKQHGSVAHLSATVIREAQAACGTTVDGDWGTKSRSAFRRTAPKVQLALGVAPDGAWGPVTEAAYQATRKLHKE